MFINADKKNRKEKIVSFPDLRLRKNKKLLFHQPRLEKGDDNINENIGI